MYAKLTRETVSLLRVHTCSLARHSVTHFTNRYNTTTKIVTVRNSIGRKYVTKIRQGLESVRAEGTDDAATDDQIKRQSL